MDNFQINPTCMSPREQFFFLRQRNAWARIRARSEFTTALVETATLKVVSFPRRCEAIVPYLVLNMNDFQQHSG